METVQEDEIINTKESDSEYDDMLPLKERNDDQSSVGSNEEDIGWDPEEPILEFRVTYQDEEGKQAKQIQEAWINENSTKRRYHWRRST